jgi:hypothetical protein
MTEKHSIVTILTNVQSRLKAPKGQTNSFGNYKYRSCEDIVEAVKPLLFEHGAYLNVSDTIELIGDRYYVKATAAVHSAAGDISATAYAREPLAKKGMDEAQVTGATSSYARKYALNGLFAIDDTKDADSQDNSEKKEQISPEPINQTKVNNAVAYFKKQIDIDAIEETHQAVKAHFKTLTNDEKIAVADLLGDKAPDSNKMYKSILKENLNYKPEELPR